MMESRRFVINTMEVGDLDEFLFIATPSSSPWTKNMFIEEMQNPIAHCFVIYTKTISKHHLMGFICFRNIGDESELLNICVHPQYRNLGIGKILMQFYSDFCSKIKITKYYLDVNISNDPAVHLYELFSYKSFGLRKNFYEGKYDALLMVKEA